MKKNTFAFRFFMLILCILCLSIPKVVFGASLAEKVYKDNEQLLQREDIRILLPKVLSAFNDEAIRTVLRPVALDLYLGNPTLLGSLNPDIDSEFIGLLSSDLALRAFFGSKQFYNVLKTPGAIDDLLKKMGEEPLTPKTLEIVDGNIQQGNPKKRLSKPFIVVVKNDLYKDLQDLYPNKRSEISGVDVIFTIIDDGDGMLSSEIKDDEGSVTVTTDTTVTVTTGDEGQAKVTLILGPNEGITQVTATVEGTNLTQTFTAAAVLDDRPTVYITPNINGNIFRIYDTFTLNLNLVNVENVTRFKATVQFDPKVVEYDSESEPVGLAVEYDSESELHRIAISGVRKEDTNVLAPLRFTVKTIDSSTITLSEVMLYDNHNNPLPAPYVLNKYAVLIDLLIDVNNDGTVNSKDLDLIDRNFGKTGTNLDGDVNTDGVVNISDILNVVSNFGTENIIGIECPDLLCIEKPGISPTTTSDATVRLSPDTVPSPAIGKQRTFSLNITNGEKVAGYQATVQFDTTALEYVESSNSDYLPADDVDDVFFITPVVDDKSGSVTVAAASQAGEKSGNGTLATITFKVVNPQASTIILSNVLLTNSTGESFPPQQTEDAQITKPITETPTYLPEDVNQDGVVNVLDLRVVANNFGKQGKNVADVNGDGVVNLIDLTLVAAAFGKSAAAPIALEHDSEIALTRANIKTWLQQAQQLNLTDPDFLRGIQVLEQLLTVLTPEKTTLLSNYPNPFNPETWIPYQLAEATDVTVTIHAMNGSLIRTLSLGHQPAGLYLSKSRAAYWDGKNEFGEQVASGLYFYTLTAGKFSATSKMLIRK